jgi:hypothetical protein
MLSHMLSHILPCMLSSCYMPHTCLHAFLNVSYMLSYTAFLMLFSYKLFSSMLFLARWFRDDMLTQTPPPTLLVWYS